MRTEATEYGNSVQAVFSVCASVEVALAATAACTAIAGSRFEGEFHDYFTADRRPQFSDAVKVARGCVALIDCDADPKLALGTMERLRALTLRNLSIVAIATDVDTDYLVQAMRAGCNEFLTKPAAADAIGEALLRFQDVASADEASHKSAGRIVAFYGVKGGVGTTTLAVHMATNLVRRHHKRTLLIDHHHELGHIALYLGLKNGQYHFDELVRNADRLDADLLNGFVAKHASGLEVLASPDVCAHEHSGSTEDMRLVLNFLRTRYDYVVIDSSMDYKALVPTIVQSSDEVCLVSTPDVAALRDLARRVEHLTVSGAATTKLRIVINRSTSDDAVSAEQIETVVRFPVCIAIPNNYSELLKAINAGEPIQPLHRSAFAQQINKWVDRFVYATATRAEQPQRARGRFPFFGFKKVKTA